MRLIVVPRSLHRLAHRALVRRCKLREVDQPIRQCDVGEKECRRWVPTLDYHHRRHEACDKTAEEES